VNDHHDVYVGDRIVTVYGPGRATTIPMHQVRFVTFFKGPEDQ
jgi:hypothetical protein